MPKATQLVKEGMNRIEFSNSLQKLTVGTDKNGDFILFKDLNVDEKIYYLQAIIEDYKEIWNMKDLANKIYNSFKNKRVKGEILRDASLASLVNFLYYEDKGIFEYFLVILSICGIIIGVLLKEGEKDGKC